MLQRRLADLIESARASGQEFAVLFIDLDDFKTVNDAFGHMIGDRVLQTIAGLLRAAAGANSTVGRLGGDEFAVLLEDPQQAKTASVMAETILSHLTQPMQIEENEIYLSASIGISAFPLDGQTPDILIQNADTAMYQAKSEGKNAYHYYSLEMETRAQERHRLTTCLHHALEQEEFEVVYQPIFSTHTRQLVSSEALVRWTSPRLGSVPPARFIPLANETGLILPLGEWILRSACRQNLAFIRAGYPGLRISVNISERQLRSKDFVASVRHILEETCMPPHLLTLELTENIFFQGFQEIDALLLEVKQMGVQLALDDFGMGYATLSCLTQIPFDEIKIDRSLSLNVTTSAGDAAIVRGIVRIARELGMPVVAEGIENEEQICFYQELGCDMLQGYYFSPPLSSSAFEARLRESRG
jgi:diguanylate cyclase (GGDEF)-like protein